MKPRFTSKWMQGALALALALSLAGPAAAQFTCPVPADTSATGFDFSEVVSAVFAFEQALGQLGEGLTAGLWPGEVDGYADFNDVPATALTEARAEVPLGVWNHLVEAIISDAALSIQGQSVDVHDVVCSAFVGAANNIGAVEPCNGTIRNLDNQSGVVSKASSAAVVVSDDITDIEDIIEAGFATTVGGSTLCAVTPDANSLTQFQLGGLGNLMGDLGDVDGDGEDNLTEWQAAVDANPTDFAAARSEFLATTLAGTSILVSITGESQLLVGAPASTYTAITIDPEVPSFTETYTWSSSNPAVVTINPTTGVANAVGAGTAVISATGNTSTVVGNRTVTTRFAKWFEICDFDDDFLGQGVGLASELGCTLTGGLLNDFFSPAYDLDALLASATPTPDSFQMTLLAYTLCAGDVGPDQTVALASHATNLASVETYGTEVTTLRGWLVPTWAKVSASPGSIALQTTGANTMTTLIASAVDQADNPFPGTYMFVSTNPAVATVNGAVFASSIVGATGVTIAATGEGSATIEVINELSGAQDNVGVSVDDLATSDVSLADPGDLNLGQSVVITPTTVGGPNVGETYTIASSNSARITVNGGTSATAVTSATLAAVGTGKANITATGTDSGDVATIEIEVFAGTDCSSAKILGDPGDEFPTSGPIVEILTGVGIWDGGAMAEVAGASPGAAAVFDGAFSQLESLGPLLVGGLWELLGVFEQIGEVPDVVAAQLGITSEMAGVTVATMGAGAILTASPFNQPSGTTLFNIGSTGALAQASGTWNLLLNGGFWPAPVNANLPGLTAFAAAAPGSATEALVNAMTGDSLLSVPQITPVTGDVIGSPIAKVGAPFFEAYDGGTVFAPGVNPMDLTNQQIADAVVAAQGDSFDFVNIAAGLDLLGAAGSPFVPAAGALGLGILAGGLAFAAAMRLRRRNA